ncbi:MAG: VCBS repeat-containing protein, partial [Planctomycetaceae bacterium]|nr:VCBS repeat-containing protein [Planctomycetaceae bacterium]
MTLSDVDQDGVPDLIVTNKLSGEVGVWRNLGHGAFAQPVLYRAGGGLYGVTTNRDGSTTLTTLEATSGVAAGAFTRGGPLDLVATDPGSNTLSLLKGLGAGRFANPVTFLTASPARVIRVADLEGNGVPDVIILGTDTVSVYRGDGRGGFLPPLTYDAGPDPTGLTVADVNHDGKPDLLIGNPYGDLLVLQGNGDGTFQPYHEADQTVLLAVADLQHNGQKDFIFADQGLDRVTVQYGVNGPQSVVSDRSQGLLAPGAVTLADLNGDGIPDLIVADSGSNNVLIYPGLGDGQFGPAINDGNGYFVGTNPVGITVADLAGGLPELAVAQAGVDQHVVAAAVGHDQVGDAVAVEVGQGHGARLQQSGGLIGQHGLGAGAVVDDHAIEPLVGIDVVLRAVAGEVGDGQLDGLVGLVVRLEGAIAVAHQDQDVAVGVADQEVELAIAQQIGDRQPIGFRRHRVG